MHQICEQQSILTTLDHLRIVVQILHILRPLYYGYLAKVFAIATPFTFVSRSLFSMSYKQNTNFRWYSEHMSIQKDALKSIALKLIA